MILKRPWAVGAICCFLGPFLSGFAHGATAERDSLDLHQPGNVSVSAEFKPRSKIFSVFITWDDIPNTDSTGAFVHDPDTSLWRVTTQGPLLSLPSIEGSSYTGDIDRTINFRVIFGGEVGGAEDSVFIRYDIQGEEQWQNTIDVGNGYTPNTPMDLIFVNTVTKDSTDLGIKLRFSPGFVDENGEFVIGCEDFEGFHIWRGIEPDGRDLIVIGEISKQEAVSGSGPGGSLIDSIYFNEFIPDLRENGVFFFNIPPGVELPVDISCLGNRVDLPLQSNQFTWFDCNAFNGFTYYYAVTTYDRGYNVLSSSQGLNKVESCLPVTGEPFACRDQLQEISIDVVPQDDLARIFAVPNPYRTGGSAFTTQNYHNFPDGKIRFVNVPSDCRLKIYTVSGDLIWETVHHNTGSGNIEWDVQNQSGDEVTSGIYIFKVENPQGDQVYGRLVIIR